MIVWPELSVNQKRGNPTLRPRVAFARPAATAALAVMLAGLAAPAWALTPTSIPSVLLTSSVTAIIETTPDPSSNPTDPLPGVGTNETTFPQNLAPNRREHTLI